MKKSKRIIALALAVGMLGCTLASADTAPQDKIPSDGIVVADEAEFAKAVKKAFTDMGIDFGNAGVAMCFTRSGECCYYNADEWTYGASLYKLPMIMKFSNMAKNGELDEYNESFTKNLEEIKERCLVYSDNSWSLKLVKYIFPENSELRQINADFAGWTDDMLPAGFYTESTYSPRFMLDILKELYVNSDEYPGVIDYMCQASPESFFRRELEGQYVIAQKYGSVDTVTHAAGIIYTEYPILLVVMTSGTGVHVGEELVGKIAKNVLDYCEVMNSRYEIVYNERESAERERIEQERLAEQERERERLEQERLASESAASQPEPEQEKSFPVVPVCAATAAAGAVIFFRKRKHRRENIAE